MEKAVFRFAPSPNGHLHMGHAYSALLNQKMAREIGGKLLLRIEDIDTTRCTPELETQMLHDLEWIGFEWDETPRRQSEHFEDYAQALEKLAKLDLVYPSALSRGEIKKIIQTKKESGEDWPSDPDGSPLYPGDERKLDKAEQLQMMSEAQTYALRIDMEKAVRHIGHKISWTEMERVEPIVGDPQLWGDVILARKDFPVSYHLCCTLDDALQGITHVVRGKDLYHATSIHSLLYALLELEKPVYHHHELILDDKLEKLSKSKNHTSLKELKQAGMTSELLKQKLGFIE
jgi:glutamyl-Q tRNA(Asp) synthetase